MDVRALHAKLLGAWNRRDAETYAGLFTEIGTLVGFDGSSIEGRQAIAEHLEPIFADHQTATYVSKVRDVRFLSDEVALLRAVAGMIPPGQPDLNPALNAVQSMLAVLESGHWRVAHFQSTPAQFHARPEEAERLTVELRSLLP
jgi:uncharacterized protein (TIGR02246 family)